MAQAEGASPSCPVCLTALDQGAAEAACGSCRTRYHAECWEENRGCAVYGCVEVPKTEARTALEIPPSYWGQETKPCPACGATIMAAAIRCRACGATFEAGPVQSEGDYWRAQGLARRLPGLKRTSVALFALSILPCTAPVAALAGTAWYALRRADVKALPSLHRALCHLGLAIGIGQTIALTLAVAFYALFR